ncbi:MAG: hypothetical protein KAR42_15400 [candidate division Zixibacteria bacterium]|nr:hypothetical protein [candidate division Zixibacteria bacterium]
MPLAKPDVTASLLPAGVTAGLTEERLLIVGQMTAGTATSGDLQENILDDKSWDTLFGDDSAIAAAIRQARRYNGVTQIDAIGLDDNGAGVAATGVFTIGGGPASEAGELVFYVGSEKFREYKIPVADLDNVTAIGDALVAAITADDESMVTAANVAGVVTVTAINKGTFGNTIGLKTTGAVATVTTAVTAMSAGATDPVLTGVFDVVGNKRYQGIAWQFQTDLDELTDFLDPRFNVDNNILDGVGFVSITDTLANHLTDLASENSQSLSYNADKLIDTTTYRGPNILEVPFIKAAGFAAIRALRRTEGTSLGRFVIARSARDAFGGIRLNSKPYFNTPFPDLENPDTGNSWTDVEIDQLKDAGGWVIDQNRPGTAVIAGEVVTTYKTDSAGNPDPTFGFLNYVDTSSVGREYIVNNTRARYPQYRATGGALIEDVDSANEASIAAFIAEMNADLASLAVVQSGVGTVGGEEVDFDKAFQEALTVTLNPVTGKFFVSMTLFIVVQLRGITYGMKVAFEV